MTSVKPGITLATFVLMILANFAFADVEPDELRGRVLDVNVESRTLTLHLLEVGDNVDEPVDTIQTYKIPENVEIRDDFQSEALPDQLDDIQEEEIVTVELDVSDRAMARGIIYWEAR